ncbi:hypothetical protein RFI_08912 [Reticulomyxa filosa]|uniref:TORTIFOLIA1/SINE1-2 N-terminal domain-containing protein n=1 Tax=Reticulomyxa filosa TaxID=46433 RepID=X6NQC2_RETFI|nr:hypothetical protein RFI_08912 [Reticulomyxa filosa]|eukprot:ETO28221.1 hypothetical protein RFI_08912 [Reticulomyxa filosa]
MDEEMFDKSKSMNCKKKFSLSDFASYFRFYFTININISLLSNAIDVQKMWRHNTTRKLSSSSGILTNSITSIRLKHGNLTSSAARHELQICICNALNQLNDNDARSNGVKTLQNIVVNIDHKLLPLLLECMYPVNGDQKQMCRKEYAHLFAFIAMKKYNCPEFVDNVFKMCKNLCQRAQDSDKSVRNACGNAAGEITKYALEYVGKDKAVEMLNKILKAPIISLEKNACNPFCFSGIFEVISFVIINANINICLQAEKLSQLLLKYITTVRDKNGHIELLVCIEKLIQFGVEQVKDHLSSFIVVILDSLNSKEWMIRKQAIQCLHCLALIFPNAQNKQEISDQFLKDIVAHLERLKFDKIPKVRTDAAVALAAWTNTVENINVKNQNPAILPTENIESVNLTQVSQDTISDEMLNKPWFDQSEEKSIDDSQKTEPVVNDSTNNSNCGIFQSKSLDDNAGTNATNSKNNNQNTAFYKQWLQQQQLMLKSIKELEHYVRSEISEMKSRIHSIERQIKGATVNYEKSREESIEAFPNECNISVVSDETKGTDWNEQFLTLIELENTNDLIHCINEFVVHNKCVALREYIDPRLFVSLTYRLIQMIQHNEFLEDIEQFLKREFITYQSVDIHVSLPKILQLAFLLSPGFPRSQKLLFVADIYNKKQLTNQYSEKTLTMDPTSKE